MVKLPKFKKNTSQKAESKPTRITTKTVEQHRREILDGAKKFKYPIQYEKHRLVINAILVGVIFVLIFFALVTWRIYKTDDTSVFLYKISQAIPFRIGQIDGQPILLSDYLAYYRSSWHYHQAKEQKNTDQQLEDKLINEYRQRAFENATKIAYAKKIASEHNLVVSQQEIDQELQAKLTYADSKISQASFDKIVKEYYGLSQWEYRQVFVQYPLLLKKAMILVDKPATELEQKITNTIKQSGDKFEIASLRETYQDKGVEFVDSGVVKYKINDSGRSEVAAKLNPGQIAPSFIARNLDSYNIIQLISKDEETLRYHVLKIPLNKFNEQLKSATDQQKLKKYIKQGE